MPLCAFDSFETYGAVQFMYFDWLMVMMMRRHHC